MKHRFFKIKAFITDSLQQKAFIIGSSQQEAEIQQLAADMQNKYKVNYITKQTDKSFEELVSNAFTNIENADLIVALKKPDNTFGQGTTYELEFAKRLRKQIRIVNPDKTTLSIARNMERALCISFKLFIEILIKQRQ